MFYILHILRFTLWGRTGYRNKWSVSNVPMSLFTKSIDCIKMQFDHFSGLTKVSLDCEFIRIYVSEGNFFTVLNIVQEVEILCGVLWFLERIKANVSECINLLVLWAGIVMCYRGSYIFWRICLLEKVPGICGIIPSADVCGIWKTN